MLLRIALSLSLAAAIQPHLRAEELSPEAAVLTRDGVTLTLADVDAYVAEAPPELRAGLLASGKRAEQILRQLLAVKNLAAEAEREGLLDDPIVRYRENWLLERFRAQLRTEQLEREASIDAKAMARERYLSDPKRFERAETVTVRHLLVDNKQRSDASARELAEQYAERIRQGDSLAELAKQHSDDPGSRERGGELPPSQREQLDLAFAEAAFALTEPGQITGPVKSAFGYHLIELISKQPAGPLSFAEVEAQLIAQIEAEHRKRVVEQHVDALNGKPIAINEAVLSQLVDRYQKRYGEQSRGGVVLDTAPEDADRAAAAADPKEP